MEGRRRHCRVSVVNETQEDCVQIHALTCDIDSPGVLQFRIQSVQVRGGKTQADQSADQQGKHLLSPKVEV